MRTHIWFVLLFAPLSLFAQDDLLASLDKTDSSSIPAIGTFKGIRLISSQTTEQVKKKHLVFNILHRFGTLNSGFNNLYGLDESNIRLSFEYGLTNGVQISVGRSSVDDMFDVGLKAKLATQKKGFHAFPLSISYYGNMGINSSKTNMYDFKGDLGKALGRFNFANQVIIAQKVNNYFSWMIAPTTVWYNLVDLSSQQNFTLALGLGVSVRISRSTRFNVEYYPRLVGQNSTTFSGLKSTNYLGVGFDIETGGHVFQIMLSNSTAMLEQQMFTQTTNSWGEWGIGLGFNISRTFSFDKKK